MGQNDAAWRLCLFYGAPRSHLQAIWKRRKKTLFESVYKNDERVVSYGGMFFEVKNRKLEIFFREQMIFW